MNDFLNIIFHLLAVHGKDIIFRLIKLLSQCQGLSHRFTVRVMQGSAILLVFNQATEKKPDVGLKDRNHVFIQAV